MSINHASWPLWMHQAIYKFEFGVGGFPIQTLTLHFTEEVLLKVRWSFVILMATPTMHTLKLWYGCWTFVVYIQNHYRKLTEFPWVGIKLKSWQCYLQHRDPIFQAKISVLLACELAAIMIIVIINILLCNILVK